MIRKIVHIDEEKCTGCGLCAEACHEDAIQMIDGKARLVKDDYCDGLGDCLPACPADAIQIVEREAAAYDHEAVQARMAAKKTGGHGSAAAPEAPQAFHGCPGSMARMLHRETVKPAPEGALPVPSHGTTGAGHMCFAASREEIAGWKQHLEKHGIEVEREFDWPNGARSLYIRDPSGNSLEFAEPKLWNNG